MMATQLVEMVAAQIAHLSQDSNALEAQQRLQILVEKFAAMEEI